TEEFLRRVLERLDREFRRRLRHVGAPDHRGVRPADMSRSEEHTSELQSPCKLVCRLLLEKKNWQITSPRQAQNRDLQYQSHAPPPAGISALYSSEAPLRLRATSANPARAACSVSLASASW